MLLKILFLIGQLLYFFVFFESSVGKALVGEQVRNAGVGEFPFIVGLTLKSKKGRNITGNVRFKHFCTGTLVSMRDVLTSEHCVTDKHPDHIRVSIGNIDLKKSKRISPLYWFTFNQWAEQRKIRRTHHMNDIAIIRLQANVTSILPAVIGNVRPEDVSNYLVILAGWGKTQNETLPSSLKVVQVKAMDAVECISRVRAGHGSTYFLNSWYFCTRGEPYALVMEGDDGGPVIYHNQIIGIIYGSCLHPSEPVHPDKLNVHLTTFHYKNFISDVINNY